MAQTIVMIHGFMNNAKVWTEWKPFFEEKGYTVLTPSWPYLEGDVEELRNNPDPRLNDLTFSDVVSYYKDIIDGLPEKPILFGHSLGGIIVQKLVELGCAEKAVCICSGPPKGIYIADKNFLISNMQLLSPLNRSGTVLMGDKWYHRYVTNDLTEEETNAFRKEYCIPSSKKVAQTIDAIDFKKPHVPILFLSGGADKSQPAAVNQKNAKAYKDKKSRVDTVTFEGRTHNILGQENWEEVADYIANWIS